MSLVPFSLMFVAAIAPTAWFDGTDGRLRDTGEPTAIRGLMPTSATSASAVLAAPGATNDAPSAGSPSATPNPTEPRRPIVYKRVGLDFRYVEFRGHNRKFSEHGIDFNFAQSFDHGEFFYDFGFSAGLGGTNQGLVALHAQSITDFGVAFPLATLSTSPPYVLKAMLAIYTVLRAGYSVFHLTSGSVSDVSDYLSLEVEFGIGLDIGGIFLAPAFLIGQHFGVSSSATGLPPANLTVLGVTVSIGCYFP